jgi:molybdopterin/thiamine biosynthesis adenylyltransferase
MSTVFSYEDAFSRNLGWVTAQEQQRLRNARVAIAGLGGVGGSHLLTLARLGVGRYHIADFDVFEIANFNRQAGASVANLGRAKADVMADMAREVNPEADIKSFPDGVTAETIDSFLQGVDIYVDGLDFFAFDARALVFAECARRSIPAVTVAPFGMGAALVNFLPGGMTFEEYFRWQGMDDTEKAIRFVLGLAPAMLQHRYLVDRSAVNLEARKGPSTPMACMLCSGIAATEALKILTERGKVWAAPYAVQFDGFRNKLVRTWRPGGNRNPLQKLALSIARRQLLKRRSSQLD